MIPRKKLQIFVSSTYEDLKDERQAAVEAILSARHIPAGMELFAAGDKSQMEVIKRWIDESDVFLLILGGRYGSIEPTSGKSYIQLEYEYAQERRKPFFAVVVDEDYLKKEKVKEHGADVLETDNPQQLKAFRAEVLTKIVRLWRNPLEIKLAIHETLADFSRRDELIGWIPGDQAVNSGAVAEEIARLAKENATLRDRLLKTEGERTTYHGLTFEKMCQLLRGEESPTESLSELASGLIASSVQLFNDSTATLFHVLWAFQDALASGILISAQEMRLPMQAFNRLRTFGVVVLHPTAGYCLTDDTRQFLLRVRFELKHGSIAPRNQ